MCLSVLFSFLTNYQLNTLDTHSLLKLDVDRIAFLHHPTSPYEVYILDYYPQHNTQLLLSGREQHTHNQNASRIPIPTSPRLPQGPCIKHHTARQRNTENSNDSLASQPKIHFLCICHIDKCLPGYCAAAK